MAEFSILECLQRLSPALQSEASLRRKQSLFALMVGLLIQRAYELGYEITLGDACARDGHMNNSLHYIRLAIDLNLFKDGVYLYDVDDHQLLGEYWESLGGELGRAVGGWKPLFAGLGRAEVRGETR